MRPARRTPSHPLTGWSFAAFGVAGLAIDLAVYAARCRLASVPAWPLEGEALAILGSVARGTLPVAALLVLGVLLPLQQWGMQPHRRGVLARTVTASLLTVLGGAWLLRLNLVGFASLWARREPVGDVILPTALVENRVWSGNIMVVLVVALLAFPLHAFVRRLLARSGMPRAPWPLWIISGLWWIGLVAVLLVGGRA